MPKRLAKNRSIEVILLQADKHLGEKFEVVNVKPIYARNILLPQEIAVLADANNKNKYQQKMMAATEERKKKAKSLDDLFMKIQELGGITLVRKANKEWTLYAKVDANEIANEIKTTHGIEVESHLLKLKKKLATTGTFKVTLMYKDVKKELAVKIELDPAEAKKHAKSAEKKGKDEEEENDDEPKKTKEELKEEKDAERAKKKEETLKRLKEKYK